MTRMIAQILDFARIRTGQSFELRLESADLRQVCRDVIDELRLGRPEQEIALNIEGGGDARFDSDRIAQVLSNLISNAIQYGTGGPISVTVREATPDAVAIDVHNVGPAIPQALQAGLFEAFRREATAGNHRSSIGLGLFIASEIVRAHGGSIVVRSPESRRDDVQRRPSAKTCRRRPGPSGAGTTAGSLTPFVVAVAATGYGRSRDRVTSMAAGFVRPPREAREPRSPAGDRRAGGHREGDSLTGRLARALERGSPNPLIAHRGCARARCDNWATALAEAVCRRSMIRGTCSGRGR